MSELGARLAQTRPMQALVRLFGDLGAGKTTFSRGFIQACGHQGIVKSPTYTLVEHYPLESGNDVYHLDLYRMAEAEELDFLGMDEVWQRSLCLVEWPEKAENGLPATDLDIHIEHTQLEQGHCREVVLTPVSDVAKQWLQDFDQRFANQAL